MVRFTSEEDVRTDEDDVDYSDDAAEEGADHDESSSAVFGNKVVHILNC